MAPRITSIWQATSSRSWGGRESVPAALHQVFLTRSVKSTLFCAEDSAIANRYGNQPGICPLPFTGLHDRRTRRALAGLLRADPPDVILCHFSHDLPLLRLVLGREKRTRLYLVKHVGPGRPKKGIIHRWIYRRVDAVLAVSEYIARRCRETYPIDPARVCVWHPGVDTERFEFRPEERLRLRHDLGLQKSDILIGYVARLTPGKGHRELLEAFVSLAASIDNVYLALPGTASVDEQPLAAELRRCSDMVPTGKRVLWPGFIENVPGWLAACDIFANPSPTEAFGLNTIEAMVVGRPVVGTTGGGTPEIITPGQDGLLVEPNNPDHMGAALRQLIEDADLRSRMGQAAQRTVRDRFALPVVVDRLLQLLGGQC